MPASYLSLSPSQWDDKISRIDALETPCRLCPRLCEVDRAVDLGICRAPRHPRISSMNLHYGEEPPISGSGGSGTVFLTHCNLRCIFCQNYPISHLGNGRDVSESELAQAMLDLQKRGAHNINFVSPTHYSAAILRALRLAAESGLTLPVVWNSNAYERVTTLALLEGVVDIYLPDIKYADEQPARELSQAPQYWQRATAAVREMFRQVGTLELDADGIATRGLLIRHLVLPEGRAGTPAVLRFIAEDLSPQVSISLMAQYFPAHIAAETPGMDRAITEAEYRDALDALERFGLENGYTQEGHFRFA